MNITLHVLIGFVIGYYVGKWAKRKQLIRLVQEYDFIKIGGRRFKAVYGDPKVKL